MKDIKLLVIGALGQLGRAIHDFYESKENLLNNHLEIKYVDIVTSEEYPWVEQLDASNFEELDNYIKTNGINYVVNCAAYTNVDKAEDDYDNAYKLNTILPETIAFLCKDNGDIPFIHISTDYVYGGLRNTPYIEDDPNYIFPDSVYGVTKRKGEINVQKHCNDFIIIRTSWLYYTGPNSFPAKISYKVNGEYAMPVRVVSDQIGTPTYAKNLAKTIIDIIYNNRDGFRVYDKYSDTKNRVGIYNYSDAGVCSWFDFACKVEELLYPSEDPYSIIVPCKTSDFPSKVKRPFYSVMDKSKILRNFPYISFNWWTWGVEELMNMNKN